MSDSLKAWKDRANAILSGRAIYTDSALSEALALIRSAPAPGREEIARELEARRDLQADAQWLRDRLALIRRICERNGPSHLKVAEIRNLLKDPS